MNDNKGKRTIYIAKYELQDRGLKVAGYFARAKDAECAVSHFGEGNWLVEPVEVYSWFHPWSEDVRNRSAFTEGEKALKDFVKSLPTMDATPSGSEKHSGDVDTPG